MKFLIVVAFVATIAAVNAGVLTDDQKAKAKEYVTACRKDFEITDDDVTALRKGTISAPTEQIKCFSNCILEKAGVLKDGVVQESVIVEKFVPNLGEEKAKEILDACRSVSGANKCETAFLLHECFVKNKGLEE